MTLVDTHKHTHIHCVGVEITVCWDATPCRFAEIYGRSTEKSVSKLLVCVKSDNLGLNPSYELLP
jgi:hypothetical protein